MNDRKLIMKEKWLAFKTSTRNHLVVTKTSSCISQDRPPAGCRCEYLNV